MYRPLLLMCRGFLQVRKLEHGRTWVENRLTSVESDLNTIRSGEKLDPVPQPVPALSEMDSPAWQRPLEGVVPSPTNESLLDGGDLSSKLNGNALVIGNKKLQDIVEESAQVLGKSDDSIGEFLSTVMKKAELCEEKKWPVNGKPVQMIKNIFRNA